MVNRPVGRSVCQLVGRLSFRSVGQSEVVSFRPISRSIDRSFGRSVGRWFCSVCRLVGRRSLFKCRGFVSRVLLRSSAQHGGVSRVRPACFGVGGLIVTPAVCVRTRRRSWLSSYIYTWYLVPGTSSRQWYIPLCT